MAETKTSPKKIIDIAHPDTVSADPSGVPLIVTNRPILKDPMVVDNDGGSKDETDAKPKKKQAPVIKKIELAPLESTKEEPAKEADATADEPVLEKPVEIEKKPVVETVEATPEAVETTPLPEPAETKPEVKEETTVEAAEQSTSDQPDQKVGTETDDGEDLLAETTVDPNAVKAAREAAEKQLALDKLTAEGTYVLPINVVERRHVKHVLIATVLIILALVTAGAAYVYLALPDVWSKALSVVGL